MYAVFNQEALRIGNNKATITGYAFFNPKTQKWETTECKEFCIEVTPANDHDKWHYNMPTSFQLIFEGGYGDTHRQNFFKNQTWTFDPQYINTGFNYFDPSETPKGVIIDNPYKDLT
jgi:hypothetical protein